MTARGTTLAAVCAAGVVGFAVGWWWKQDEDDEVTEEVESLARRNIRELEPYRCARDDYDEGVLLDANENALGPAVTSRSGAKDMAKGLNRYPDPYQRSLKDLIGKYRGVTHEQIFVGVGSDEAIDLLFRVFCEPRKHNVVIMPPTYGMYKVSAAANDVAIFKANLEPETFDIDVVKVLSTVTSKTRLVFVTSPGNPTSICVSRSRLIELLEKLPKTCLLVVDEAYIDFTTDHLTMAPLVTKYPYLVVLHTLSKAFGLAGARVGTAIADPAVISLMNNLKAPYNMNSLTSRVAQAALADQAAVEDAVKTLTEQRTSLANELRALTDVVIKVYPSDANFLLVKFKYPPKVKLLYKTLADNGVVVRYRGDQTHCDGCLRITVGTADENVHLINHLNRFAKAILLDKNGSGH